MRKSERKEAVIRLRTENPTWNVYDIVDEMRKTYPGYTDSAVRTILRNEGMKAPPAPMGRGVPYQLKTYGRDDRHKPIVQTKVKPQSQIRASVHSYHGRSRLSAGYTELL